ncbi:MAG: hypothetical protein DRI61_17110 [Chloroflexi bacterium]|nr:MAG: hypothetical protein DRI61_17110 [Chloroflexota bacterium]
MRNISFLITLGIIAGLIFSRCIINQTEEKTLSLEKFSADKEVYHSSELMKLTVEIHSSSELKNVSIVVKGINGRLNQKKTLDLNEGTTKISFAYKLPRCNVCGGIRAGNYDLTCEVTYDDTKLEKSTTVKIQQ